MNCGPYNSSQIDGNEIRIVKWEGFFDIVDCNRKLVSLSVLSNDKIPYILKNRASSHWLIVSEDLHLFIFTLVIRWRNQTSIMRTYCYYSTDGWRKYTGFTLLSIGANIGHNSKTKKQQKQLTPPSVSGKWVKRLKQYSLYHTSFRTPVIFFIVDSIS